ncbi:MAG: DinB family protein [Akkermansiaceae bacterium]
MPSLISSNIYFLRQGLELLSQLDDSLYDQAVPSFYGSSLGGHMRHCIEHYLSFINGVESEAIDYDARSRDRSVEVSVATAQLRIQTIIEQLNEVLTHTSLNTSVKVQMDCSMEKESDWQVSTIGRELQFLVSHTVHHFAMMKGMCAPLGAKLPEGFGIAPSTMKHLQKLS